MVKRNLEAIIYITMHLIQGYTDNIGYNCSDADKVWRGGGENNQDKIVLQFWKNVWRSICTSWIEAKFTEKFVTWNIIQDSAGMTEVPCWQHMENICLSWYYMVLFSKSSKHTEILYGLTF